MRLLGIMVLIGLLVQPLLAQSTLIPVGNRRAHVYDGSRGLLYVSTTSGKVERYDVNTKTLLSPLNVGSSLNGLDITPDGGYLYVTEGQYGATSGFLRKVDLATGIRTNLTYDLTHAELGSWDIKIMSNGKAMFTTNRSGSGGGIPVREVDLATGTINQRLDAPGNRYNNYVVERTQLSRSGNREALFFREGNVSTGPVFTYDAPSDTFPSTAEVQAFTSNNLSVVNHDGSLVAMEFGSGLSIMNSNLDTVELIDNLTGGLVFHPSLDVLFAANPSTDELVALNTNTWQEIARYPIGESIGSSSMFGSGEMSMSDDGSLVFMSTNNGVRMIAVPEPGALVILGLGCLALVGRRN